jgi:hypothetical protein
MNRPPFEFGLGDVTWSVWDIDDSRPLREQMWPYERDLILVEYRASGLALDVSWLQDGEVSRGAFLVMLARGEDWDEPLMKRRPRSLKGLRAVLAEMVATANEMEKRSRKRLAH